MAGSYGHCCKDDGSFWFDLIENLGDAYEACEQMHWMINHLTNGDQRLIKLTVEAYYESKAKEAA